jgi:hypothetical protein
VVDKMYDELQLEKKTSSVRRLFSYAYISYLEKEKSVTPLTRTPEVRKCHVN